MKSWRGSSARANFELLTKNLWGGNFYPPSPPNRSSVKTSRCYYSEFLRSFSYVYFVKLSDKIENVVEIIKTKRGDSRVKYCQCYRCMHNVERNISGTR